MTCLGAALPMGLTAALLVTAHVLLQRSGGGTGGMGGGRVVIGGGTVGTSGVVAGGVRPSRLLLYWLLFSLLGSYPRFATDIQPTMGTTGRIVAHLAFATMLACLWHCATADPGWVPAWQLHAEDRRAVAELLRAGRCKICQGTIRLRDHHCTWIASCVGQGNRRSFYAFLAIFWPLCLWFAIALSGSGSDVSDEGGGDGVGVFDGGDASIANSFGLTGIGLRGNRGEANRDGDSGDGGGYDVDYDKDYGATAHAFYAVAGAAMGFAMWAQQTLLIGAGLTSLELKRAGRQGRRLTWRRLCPPCVQLWRNWARFLTATELSAVATAAAAAARPGAAGGGGGAAGNHPATPASPVSSKSAAAAAAVAAAMVAAAAGSGAAAAGLGGAAGAAAATGTAMVSGAAAGFGGGRVLSSAPPSAHRAPAGAPFDSELHEASSQKMC
ncbi:unnamed protein product [Phaeothamnion confervicola]